MNSNALLDALKEHTGSPSDQALAHDILKVHKTSVRDMRLYGLSDAMALKVAGMLGLEPAEVLASIHAERAKDPAVRKVWEKLAKILKAAAAGLLVVLGIGLTATPDPVQASQTPSLYIMSNRRKGMALRALVAGFAVLLGFSSPVLAADPWSDQDKALEAAYLTVTAIDWRQTLYMIDHPEGSNGQHHYSETNILLGRHPSEERVNIGIATAMIAHVVVTHYLPSRWRPYWQMAWIGIESGAVANNIAIGVRIGF